MSEPRATLELELAADAALLATARLFAAAAARTAGCDEDAVEDVRLAVSEACARSMRGATDGDRLSVAALLGVGEVDIVVEGPAGPIGPEDIDTLDLVATLFPDASSTEDAGRITVRFGAPAR